MHRSLSLAGAIGFQPNRLSGLVPLNPPNVIPNDGVRGEVGKTWIVVEKRCECGSSNCPAGPRNRTDVLQPKRNRSDANVQTSVPTLDWRASAYHMQR